MTDIDAVCEVVVKERNEEIEALKRENAELHDRSESWRVAHVAWQTWAAFMLSDNTMGDRVARARIEAIVEAAKAWRETMGVGANYDAIDALMVAVDAAVAAERGGK